MRPFQAVARVVTIYFADQSCQMDSHDQVPVKNAPKPLVVPPGIDVEDATTQTTSNGETDSYGPTRSNRVLRNKLKMSWSMFFGCVSLAADRDHH